MSESQPTSVTQPNPPKTTSEKSKDQGDRLPKLFFIVLGIILVLVDVVMFGFFYKPAQPPQTYTFIPTIGPTNTLIPSPSNKSTTIPRIYNTPTDILSRCILWSSLTKYDVGSSRCVYGRVVKTYGTDQYQQIIRFSNSGGTFLIWDHNASHKVSLGDCIAAEGLIHQDPSELYMNISGTTFYQYTKCR